LIEDAYTLGEALGLSVWNQDEAGPFQTVPYEGQEWTPEGQPKCQAHEYIRDGTAKCLTLFHPASGQVRVKGVTSCPNRVLHSFLQQELEAILAEQEAPEPLDPVTNRMLWERWQAGLSSALALPDDLPPLRMLLIWDNLAGHKTPVMVDWLIMHGIMPLYTPLSGSWLNMAESVQRIIVRRALEGHHISDVEILKDWLRDTIEGWNRHRTPFIWGGKRHARRDRAYARRHRQGGSGATTQYVLPRHIRSVRYYTNPRPEIE
jgi:hypothetical protein